MSRRAPILASVAVGLSLLGSCDDSGTQEAAAKAAEIEAKVNAALLAKDEADKKAEAAAGRERHGSWIWLRCRSRVHRDCTWAVRVLLAHQHTGRCQ